MGARRSREEITGILMFNVTFFGTLAWLASAADVAHSKGWWYERGSAAAPVPRSAWRHQPRPRCPCG